MAKTRRGRKVGSERTRREEQQKRSKKGTKEGGRRNLVTPVFTANFAAQLLKARSIGSSDPFYSVVCVLPKKHEFWKKLERALNQALKDKFGKIPKKLRDWPIKDGDQSEYEDWHGCYYIQPKSYEKPGIVDRDLDEIIDPQEIYSGMECRATVRCSAWHHQETNGRGVSVYLDNVQKVADGEQISGKPKAIDDFTEYVDDDDDDYDEKEEEDDEEEDDEDDDEDDDDEDDDEDDD